MARGYRGETCAQAITSSIRIGDVKSFSELLRDVKGLGSWKEDTICQHLMSTIVNLPPARRHWKKSKAFLFLRADGRYEVYDPGTHPTVLE